MKTSKELRQRVNNARSRDGKKNGVVRWLYEHWGFEKEEGKPKPKYRTKENCEAGHE